MSTLTDTEDVRSVKTLPKAIEGEKMGDIKVSIFASATRPHLWKEFLDSLLPNKIEYEVVFGGDCTFEETEPFTKKYKNFRYIHTGKIKPAQVYEATRRECVGELINWSADDCEYEDGLLDDVYDFWRKNGDWKTIVSVRTDENDTHNDLNEHRFFGWNVNTPLMAPLGFISRQWLEDLGGLDRRYICGQYENDIVMRSNHYGGNVVKFEDKCVRIEHIKKHGNTTAFWSEYDHDREVLENSWVIGGYKPKPGIALDINKKTAFFPIVADREVSLTQLDKFEPYDGAYLLTRSQSFSGKWK